MKLKTSDAKFFKQNRGNLEKSAVREFICNLFGERMRKYEFIV